MTNVGMDICHNHFILAFDLASKQEASDDFIHPELLNCSISVQLTFDRALAAHVEILYLNRTAQILYYFGKNGNEKLNYHLT